MKIYNYREPHRAGHTSDKIKDSSGGTGFDTNQLRLGTRRKCIERNYLCGDDGSIGPLGKLDCLYSKKKVFSQKRQLLNLFEGLALPLQLS